MAVNQLGQFGESFVVDHLKNQGFKILEQNYKKFFGEIDIIATKEDLLIFVEVKTRKNIQTSMFELVLPSKQRKIILTAKSYLSLNNLSNITSRFDVALVHYAIDQAPELNYIPNAFYGSDF